MNLKAAELPAVRRALLARTDNAADASRLAR